MQFIVNPFKYLHKLGRVVTVQPAKFANESKAVTRIVIVPEIFQTITVIAPVKKYITRCVFVLVKRVQKIPAYLKGKRNKMLEHGHPLICSL